MAPVRPRGASSLAMRLKSSAIRRHVRGAERSRVWHVHRLAPVFERLFSCTMPRLFIIGRAVQILQFHGCPLAKGRPQCKAEAAWYRTGASERVWKFAREPRHERSSAGLVDPGLFSRFGSVTDEEACSTNNISQPLPTRHPPVGMRQIRPQQQA